jgi:hypothetical protein
MDTVVSSLFERSKALRTMMIWEQTIKNYLYHMMI